MPKIHLMVGFMGFGKTTIAKQLAQNLSALRFTHDEIMLEKYGRNPDDFQTKYKLVDYDIRNNAAKAILSGQDVILDYGFWTQAKRLEYYQWAKSLTDDVIFHNVSCGFNLAKQRTLKRSQTDKNSLFIDENAFNTLAKQFEPWKNNEDYPVVLHNAQTKDYIGKTVMVIIDRTLGSKHPKFGFEYPINYGYIPFTKSGDDEELDAYVLSVNHPLQKFEGRCIGLIHRTDDDDDKLIIVPKGIELTDDEIEQQTSFQEKWFNHTLLR